jgi:hypothetical protein
LNFINADRQVGFVLIASSAERLYEIRREFCSDICRRYKQKIQTRLLEPRQLHRTHVAMRFCLDTTQLASPVYVCPNVRAYLITLFRLLYEQSIFINLTSSDNLTPLESFPASTLTDCRSVPPQLEPSALKLNVHEAIPTFA